MPVLGGPERLDWAVDHVVMRWPWSEAQSAAAVAPDRARPRVEGHRVRPQSTGHEDTSCAAMSSSGREAAGRLLSHFHFRFHYYVQRWICMTTTMRCTNALP